MLIELSPEKSDNSTKTRKQKVLAKVFLSKKDKVLNVTVKAGLQHCASNSVRN